MKCVDTIIRNGHVLDPYEGTDTIRNIAVDNGRIVEYREGMSAVQNVDAEGCWVFPGLIDFHIHGFGDGSGWGIAKPDLLLATGVTSAVDAGSAGCVNYEAMHRTMIQPSLVRMKALLNVYSGGTLDMHFDELLDINRYNVKQMGKIIRQYEEEIIGLKIRISKSITGEYGMTPFYRAVELARELNLPLCVHVTDPPCPQSEIVKQLIAGDIVCHIFHSRGETILDENGKIYDAVWKARERGVLFDVAHGNNNFGFHVVKRALEEEFIPDIISTDMCKDKLNISSKTKSLAQVMSLYLDLGLDIGTVIKAVTKTPAGLMNMEGKIGTLAPGAYGDVSVFKLEERDYVLRDYDNATYRAHKILIPQMTICNGEIAFCQQDFNLCKE